LSAPAFGRALAIVAERAVPIILQIESGGAVQMHAGTVINVSSNGRWLNVIDPTFNFHLFEEAIVETWAVIRPTFDGPAISLEAIDLAGNSVASIFGAMPPGCGTAKAGRPS
jgi:putative hemin transport protein